ncbi:mechanosensitive ion channel domain-containing protein [Pedobacter sp. JY14-1]|uniref:mechanosensitive ion channel domain-containing protein n=1 Tax=Pedobacter sp. JY14-1 TaxID=3034151 RepID=UPI0023E2C346|nr:mechanosensitive ion channel domain-containing protein [Pedobacter sp. JY14-1]
MICWQSTAIAQQDTIRQQLDSFQNAQLDKQLLKVRKLAQDREADSLKRTDLETQVARLSSTDNLQKAELMDELARLRQRDALRLTVQKKQIDSLRKVVQGFPVILLNDTLFQVFVRQGSFTAQDRALAIAGRLKEVAGRYNFRKDSVVVNATDLSADIIYGNLLLVSVSDQDALWQNTSRELLATQWRSIIVKALSDYNLETSWQVLFKESLLALLVIVVVCLIIYGVNRFFNWLRQKVLNQKGGRIQGFKLKGLELLTIDQQLTVLNFIFIVLRWLVILFVLYLALPVLFGIFPYTRDLSVTLLDYIVSPLKRIFFAIWNYIPNLITITVLIIVFRYVIKFFRYLKTEVERGRLTIPGFYSDWANPTYQIIRVLMLAFMLIVVFPYLPGSESPIFKGVSVFMGVLFTFGSAGALSNVVAGLVLTYMRAFKVGDRVKIGEVNGDVIEKTVLVTRIRTIKNELISIPNSTVMSSHTTNYSSEALSSGLIINTTVTIGYDVPWRQVHELLIAAATDTDFIERESPPFVLQTSLDDYYVSYNINAYTRRPDKQAFIYSSLHANIQDRFNKAGVEIMSPHYRAVRDGNTVTLPANYLPGDYQPPGFRVDPSRNHKRS